MRRFIQGAAALALALGGPASAQAQVSFNVGWASEYHFRGVRQKNSSASAGVDYVRDGFYIGSWAADVGDGLEVDGYLGYGVETEAGFTASLGLTGYYYTGEFDDTYEEANLNFGYGVFAFEYSAGRYANFDGPSQEYRFAAGTVALDNGVYGTYGAFGGDFDGSYIELGWGGGVSGLDIGVAAIFSSEELSDEKDGFGMAAEGESLVFTIGKTW